MYLYNGSDNSLKEFIFLLEEHGFIGAAEFLATSVISKDQAQKFLVEGQMEEDINVLEDKISKFILDSLEKLLSDENI